MANTPRNLALIAGAVTLGLSLCASAADGPELISGATAQMLAETCSGCHGTDGASLGPASPTLAAMNGEYFVEVMQGFRDDSVFSTIMGRIAKGYTDEEFELMATYFAGKPFVPAKQEFDQALADKGAKLHDKYCEKCHSDGGKVLEDEEYYILAGQWTPYLHNAIADFQADRRDMPKKMGKKLSKLVKKEGDDGLKALFAFYASEQ